MPQQMEQFTDPVVGLAAMFKKYADGTVWRYVKGEDYQNEDSKFASAARSWGSRNGYETSAHVVKPDGGAVEVQFSRPEQNGSGPVTN